MSHIKLDAGDRTEELTQFIVNNLSDDELDQIEIERTIDDPKDFASEPITLAVTLTLGTAAISGIVRLIERWLDGNIQLKQMNIVAEGFSKSDVEGKTLAKLAESYSKVSLSYGIAQESWKSRGNALINKISGKTDK